MCKHWYSGQVGIHILYLLWEGVVEKSDKLERKERKLNAVLFLQQMHPLSMARAENNGVISLIEGRCKPEDRKNLLVNCHSCSP